MDMRKFKEPWVSPDESLPKFGEHVLICRKRAGELLVEQAWFDSVYGAGWKIYGSHCKRIIAWRPMPKPPEENRENMHDSEKDAR